MPIRRRRRRLLGLAGMVALLLGGPARTSAQEAGTGYEYFSASGTADGLTAVFEIINLLPINRPVDVSTVTAEARFETTRSTGLAVLPYPGDAIINVPGTAAGFVGQSLPGYPLVARAEHPTVPHQESTPAAGTLPGVATAKMVADADGSKASGDAAVSDLISAGVFTIGSVRTTAASRAVSPTTYEARAVSFLGDIDLGAGAVHIDSITAVVEVALADGKATVKENRLVVDGVSAGGQAARITGDGLEAGGESQGPGLGDAIELAPGLTVRTVEGSEERKELGVTARSGSVVVQYDTLIQGAPSRTRFLLGSADATVEARGALGPPAGPSDAGSVVPSIDPRSVLGGTTGLAAIPPRPGPGGLRPTTPTPGPFTAAPIGLVDPLDFRPVYAWLALAGLSVAATRRWIAAQTARARTAPSDLRDLWRW